MGGWRDGGRDRTVLVTAQQPAPAPAAAAADQRGAPASPASPARPPRLAVPDLLALSADAETQEAAKTIGQVLWDDLNFEREFAMIPRDTYKSIPAAASIGEVPFDRWRELGADGVVVGTVQKTATGVRVEMRLYNVRARQQMYGREYSGSAANPRLYAHTMADEIHDSQRSLRGVARTKLTFSSDRNREPVAGTVEKRDVKEIYVADYDGANQRRITINRSLNINPNWSPDGRSIAYTSYRTGVPDILISNIYVGTMENPAQGRGPELPAGVLARRHAHRVHVESRRQHRDLRDEPRRLERAAADRQSRHRRHADVVAHGHADRVHVRTHRDAADLGGRRRRHRPAADFVRGLRRPRDVVADAVQRDCVRGAHGAGLRHQDPEHRQRRDPPDHVRRGQQREPRVVARTAGTWRSCRPARAAARSSAWIATARTCGSSRETATTSTPNWSQ